MEVRLLGERVLVIADEKEETTASGLVVPDSAQSMERMGVVAKVGPGRRTEAGEIVPADVDEGDRVMFHRHAGTALTLDDQDYLLFGSANEFYLVEEPEKLEIVK